MKAKFIRLGCFLVLIIFTLSTQSQTKSTQKKKSTSSSKEVPPPPPPPPSKTGESEDVKIGTIDDQKSQAPEKPVINFDTTTVVQDSFTADIMKLMKVTGAMDIGIMMAKGIEDKKSTEKVPMMKEFYNRFYNELEHGEVNRLLINYFVKVYRKHFTQQEINSLIAFYQTDLGKKAISVLPQITQEAMVYGQRVGEYFGQKIMYEIMLEEQKKSN
jgi:uncharacterized protein